LKSQKQQFDLRLKENEIQLELNIKHTVHEKKEESNELKGIQAENREIKERDSTQIEEL